MTYSAVVLADSPIAYWRLGEASGTTAADSSGNGRDLTYNGSPTLGEPALINDVNTSVRFNGTTAQYAIRNPIAGWPTTDITVEMWVKASDLTKGTFLSYAVGGQDNEVLVDNTKDIRLTIKGTTTSNAGCNIGDGLKHHVVWTWRNSDGRAQLWFDGVLRYTQTGIQTSASITTGGSIVLAQDQDSVGGGFDATQALDGWLDEVAVYSTVLADARIQAHYGAGVDDGFAPFMVKAESFSVDRVRVYFDESMQGLDTAANFTIPTCVVTLAVGSADRTYTDLTTTGMVVGTSYTVTAGAGVTDDLGNALSDASADFRGGISSMDTPDNLAPGDATSETVISVFGGSIIDAAPLDASKSTATPTIHGGDIIGLVQAPVSTASFFMRAFRQLSGTYVYWEVTGTPDTTGARSPYPPVQLEDIVVERTFPCGL